MSVTITAQDIADVAPELATETEGRLSLYIDLARQFVSEDAFGARAKNAIMLYACHLLTLGNREGVGGNVTAERVGDLQKTYGQTPSQEDYDLSQTSYGSMFLQLRKAYIFSAKMIG